MQLLDGVLIAARVSSLLDAGVRFDERFDFHFYDLDFSRQANAAGLAVGTWQISATHVSVGNYKTDGWIRGREVYRDKWQAPPRMEYFEANLKALSGKQPELVSLLRNAGRSHVKTFPSAEGPPTASVEHGGEAVYLHNRYNPQREAMLAIKENYDGAGCFFFLGFGLGYTLDAVIEKYGGQDRQYFIVEADLRILRAAFEERDLASMLASHDIYFAWPPLGPELAKQLQQFNFAIYKKVCCIMHPPSLKLKPGYYKAAAETLQSILYEKTCLKLVD